MPSSQAATRSARPERRQRRRVRRRRTRCHVEPLPGHARREHGVLRRIDQIGRAQRRPPRGSIVGRLTVAEWKRRRGDAADDHDDRRGAELRAVDPAAELHVLKDAAFDRDREMFDDQPPRTQVGGCESGHRGIV